MSDTPCAKRARRGLSVGLAIWFFQALAADSGASAGMDLTNTFFFILGLALIVVGVAGFAPEAE